MKTLQEIRDELKMIREYYFALSSAANGAEILVPNDIARLMESYSRMVKGAQKPVWRAYRGLFCHDTPFIQKSYGIINRSVRLYHDIAFTNIPMKNSYTFQIASIN